MSCADGSQVSFVNNTTTTITFVSASASQGSLQKVPATGTVYNPQTKSGTIYCYSGSGTKGVAAGSLSIVVGPTSTPFVLNFSFDPSSVFGACPTSAQTEGPITLGSYTATPYPQNGSNQGQASIYWSIT